MERKNSRENGFRRSWAEASAHHSVEPEPPGWLVAVREFVEPTEEIKNSCFLRSHFVTLKKVG
jgi:hypothetical protein